MVYISKIPRFKEEKVTPGSADYNPVDQMRPHIGWRNIQLQRSRRGRSQSQPRLPSFYAARSDVVPGPGARSSNVVATLTSTQLLRRPRRSQIAIQTQAAQRQRRRTELGTENIEEVEPVEDPPLEVEVLVPDNPAAPPLPLLLKSTPPPTPWVPSEQEQKQGGAQIRRRSLHLHSISQSEEKLEEVGEESPDGPGQGQFLEQEGIDMSRHQQKEADENEENVSFISLPPFDISCLVDANPEKVQYYTHKLKNADGFGPGRDIIRVSGATPIPSVLFNSSTTRFSDDNMWEKTSEVLRVHNFKPNANDPDGVLHHGSGLWRVAQQQLSPTTSWDLNQNRILLYLLEGSVEIQTQMSKQQEETFVHRAPSVAYIPARVQFSVRNVSKKKSAAPAIILVFILENQSESELDSVPSCSDLVHSSHLLREFEFKPKGTYFWASARPDLEGKGVLNTWGDKFGETGFFRIEPSTCYPYSTWGNLSKSGQERSWVLTVVKGNLRIRSSAIENILVDGQFKNCIIPQDYEKGSVILLGFNAFVQFENWSLTEDLVLFYVVPF